MLLEAPSHEGPYGHAHVLAEERADEYRWALEDHGVDSSRLWFSRVYLPDWRKLERIFKTFHDIIDGEGFTIGPPESLTEVEGQFGVVFIPFPAFCQTGFNRIIGIAGPTENGIVNETTKADGGNLQPQRA